MKLNPGEAKQALNSWTMSYYLQRENPDGSTISVNITSKDVADYINDLEHKLIRLAAKVADSL